MIYLYSLLLFFGCGESPNIDDKENTPVAKNEVEKPSADKDEAKDNKKEDLESGENDKASNGNADSPSNNTEDSTEKLDEESKKEDEVVVDGEEGNNSTEDKVTKEKTKKENLVLDNNRTLEEKAEEAFAKAYISIENGNLETLKGDISNLKNTLEGEKEGINDLVIPLFHHAAAKNNLEAIEWFKSEKGIKLNTVDKDKNGLIHFAAKENSLKVMEYLIKNKADFNAKNVDGNAPLHLAVKYDSNEAVIKLLSQRRIDVKVENNAKETPLMIASSLNKKGIVEKLLEKNPDSNDIIRSLQISKEKNNVEISDILAKEIKKRNLDKEKTDLKPKNKPRPINEGETGGNCNTQ